MTTNNAQTSEIVEGIARVVRVENGTAWLEPEQTASCGSCAASSRCGAKQEPGIGTITSRIAARRFSLDAEGLGLAVGERVVIGVGQGTLMKGALLVYALPLLTAFAAGGTAQGLWGSDGATMLAMAAGLGVGLLAARLVADRLSAGGDMAPRFLRRAAPGETCR